MISTFSCQPGFVLFLTILYPTGSIFSDLLANKEFLLRQLELKAVYSLHLHEETHSSPNICQHDLFAHRQLKKKTTNHPVRALLVFFVASAANLQDQLYLVEGLHPVAAKAFAQGLQHQIHKRYCHPSYKEPL